MEQAYVTPLSPLNLLLWKQRSKMSPVRRTPRLLQDFLDAVAAGTAVVPIGHVYRFDEIAEAHAAMEQNLVAGKLVVTT